MIEIPDSRDIVTSYECECLERFYGDRCESYNPCSTSPCLNLAACVPMTNETYTCECTYPSISGSNCQIYDFCTEMDLCLNEANCSIVDAQPEVLVWSKLRTVSVKLDGAVGTLQVS